MCLSTQNPTWLPYWLALLAQVPRLSDVQLLFSYGNIDIDLSNLQNILCQKSLNKKILTCLIFKYKGIFHSFEA